MIGNPRKERLTAATPMSAELSPDLPLEIAHLLLIDVVGYSKLLVNDQVESLAQLKRIVRSTYCFRAAEAKDKLIRLPTGDGMALLFLESLDQPSLCALEISQALHNPPEIHVVNLCKDGFGNQQVPEQLKRRGRWKQTSGADVRPITAPRWPKSVLSVAVLLFAVALAVSFSTFFHRASPPTTRNLSEIATPILGNSIAVLPFQNLSDEKQNAYFADCVQDEILTNIARVADLKVISRTSTMQYKTGAQRNLREIAKTLGLAHVVEGSVQRSGGRVRVSVQLIDARTDGHLWAESYDRDIADVFAIENELAEQIVAKLKSKLSPQEKAAIEQKPTTDLAAHDLYIRAKTLIASSALSASQA